MKKGLKKLIATVLTAAMAMSVGVPAFANEENINTSNSVTENAFYNFLLDEESAKTALNTVAQSTPISEDEIMLYDGTVLSEEIRELSVDENVTIVNTRTLTEKAGTRSVSDSYELFFQGTQGGAGELVANYTYETSSNGGEVYVKFNSVYGRQINLLDGLYRAGTSTPTYSKGSLPWATASIKFTLEHNLLYSGGIIGDLDEPFWKTVSYEHSIEFDNKGTYTMSWF